MKIKILVALIFLPLVNTSFAANYILTIGNERHEISLDKTEQIKIGDSYVSVKLEQKDVLTYSSENFSFEYPRRYSPSKSDLGDGILQTAMMTPLGSVVMVQEYLTINPSGLIDLMINEVTKEEREYGYKIKSSDISITLSDGKRLKGKVVTSKYKGSDIKRYFYTYGVKDSGLFIMTQIDYESEPSAEALINQVINSLKITMK